MRIERKVSGVRPARLSMHRPPFGVGRMRARPGVGGVALLFAIWLALVAPPLVAQVAAGSLDAQLDRSVIALDETARLTVIATDLDGELDTSALQRDFDVVGRSRSNQVEILNGVRRDRVNWVLELAPRRVGVFTVPPVSVAGVTGELLTLEVRDAPIGGARDLFVEAEVDTDTPYVQAQVLLTLRVFQAVQLLEGALAEPSGDDLDVQRLGEDTRRVEERDGRRYEVIERRFALFPRASGTTVIPPIALEASLPVDPDRVRGFFTPSRRVVRRTAPITLEVQPREAGTASWWLPAGAVAVEADWLGDRSGAQVGQPLTRSITVTARGVTPDRMPEIDPPEIPGASVYAEAPETVSRQEADGIVTTRRLTWAVIPERAGTLVLPDVAIDWFDTATGAYRQAVAPSSTLEVAALESSATPIEAVRDVLSARNEAIAQGADAVAEGQRNDDRAAGGDGDDTTGDGALAVPGTRALPTGVSEDAGPWRLLTFAAATGWVFTAFAWWWGRRQRLAERHTPATAGAGRDGNGPRPDRAALREGALAALAAEDTGALESALLDLAAVHLPARAGRSLTGLAQALDERLGDAEDPDARTLRQLDALRYRPTTGDSAALSLRDLTPAVSSTIERLARDGPADAATSARSGGAVLPEL